MLRRLPLESTQPLLVFAVARLAIAAVGLAAMVVLGLPEDGRAIAVVAGIAVPWSVFMIFVTLKHGGLGLSPWVALGDLATLLAIELVAPETYGGVRFAALFLVAAHAHFQG
ncbi:MAG: hypothetical protein ACRDSN_03105, partial [Pseudonocardiaceae bacterium]